MSEDGSIAVAKKKRKPVPESWGSKPIVASVRGSLEWKQWVEELALENRQSVANLIDMALARLAKDTGFRDPPDR